MASVRKVRKASGLVIYQAIWREPGKGGKVCQRTRNFAKHADARGFAQEMAKTVESRGVGDPANHTLEQYLKGWHAALAQRGERAATTLALYKSNIALIASEIGHIPLARLTARDIDLAYTRLLRSGHRGRGKGRKGKGGPLSAKTMLGVQQMLRGALEQARKWRLISENPAKDAASPSPQKSRVKPFTRDEVSRLLDAAEADGELGTPAIVGVLLLGLRRSEVLALAFDAVDLDGLTIEIRRSCVEVDHRPLMREHGKTQAATRTIAMPLPLADILRVHKTRILERALAYGRDYCRDPLLCFPGFGGGPMDPQRLTIRMRRLMQKAGVSGCSPCHAWRHFSATTLLHATGNLKVVQSRLGHVSAAFTMQTYIHGIESGDREAASHLGDILMGKKR